MSSRRPIDPRRTFLAKHIEQQLLERSRSDILAVDDLYQEILAIDPSKRNDPQVCQFINRRRFFYEDQAELSLYIPLRIQAVAGPGTPLTDTEFYNRVKLAYYQVSQSFLERGQIPPAPPSNYADLISSYPDLTQLIYEMNARLHDADQPDRRGIVLVSSSGGGKTTACRKALYDCLCSGYDPQFLYKEDKLPRLSGFVPCWIKLPPNFSGNMAQQIEDLLLITADVKSLDSRELIKHWLTNGPPLLIFIDLNTVPDDDQRRLAQALTDFQARYGEYGHRCVLTYRTTRPDAPAMLELGQNQNQYFGFYELKPFQGDQAKSYVRAFSSFRENLLFNELQLPNSTVDVRDLEQDYLVLDELIERTKKSVTTQQGSLIDTPLLTHFVASLPSKTLKKVHSLSDLCAAVVDKHLDREKQMYGQRMDCLTWQNRPLEHQDFPWLSKTLMTRFALAVLAKGNNNTRLARSSWSNLLQFPDSDCETGLPPDWWPEDDFWHDSDYYQEQCANREAEPWLEYTLLNPSAQELGFVHDSLLYYFSGALGLVEYKKPGTARVFDPNWVVKLAQRLHHQPEQWVLPARFLAGRVAAVDRARNAQQPNKHGLLTEQVLLELVVQCQSQPGIALLSAYCQELDRQLLFSEVNKALNAVAGHLLNYPQSTAPEVRNYLMKSSQHDSAIQRFALLLEQTLS